MFSTMDAAANAGDAQPECKGQPSVSSRATAQTYSNNDSDNRPRERSEGFMGVIRLPGLA